LLVRQNGTRRLDAKIILCTGYWKVGW